MKKLLFAFSLLSVLWGCDDFLFEGCEDVGVTGNYKHEIPFGTYYSYPSLYMGGYAKRILTLNEDSSYVSFWLDLLADTIGIAEGSYSIHKPPKDSKRIDNTAYSFTLSQKTGRTKLAWENDHVVRLEDFIESDTIYESDTILLDVQVADSCFTLTSLFLDDWYCRKYYYSGESVFCANAACRDSVLSVSVPKDSLE